jgi:hypothetical protein
VDPIVWGKIKGSIHDYFDLVHIPTYLNPKGSKCPTRWIKHLGLSADKKEETNTQSAFSPDLSLGAFGGGTVTMENLQFAVHIGLNPIYIIGCDHYYKGESNITMKTPPIVVSEQQNHFVKNYREPGEIVNPAPIETMNLSYKEAFNYCEENSIQVFNATRGGYLEIFPRKDLDTLI